jgi:transposase-like protein
MAYKPRNRYTPEVRLAAVQAVLDGEQSGKVARRYRVAPNTLYQWTCSARKELAQQAEGAGTLPDATSDDVPNTSVPHPLVLDLLGEPKVEEDEAEESEEFKQLGKPLSYEGLEAAIEVQRAEILRLQKQLAQTAAERDMWASKALEAQLA